MSETLYYLRFCPRCAKTYACKVTQRYCSLCDAALQDREMKGHQGLVLYGQSSYKLRCVTCGRTLVFARRCNDTAMRYAAGHLVQEMERHMEEVKS